MIGVLILTLIGTSFGLILGFLNKVFEVKEDPKLKLVIEALPGYNCGACGYPGCKVYADAILKGEKLDKCRPGRDKTREKLELIMAK
jgi:electron transport complex protein RnfB